jgi:hypothetical protein
MTLPKRPQRSTVLFWSAWLGMAYFNAFSSWQINAALRMGVAIVPLILVWIYLTRRTAPEE